MLESLTLRYFQPVIFSMLQFDFIVNAPVADGASTKHNVDESSDRIHNHTTGERRHDGLNPMEPLRLQGILCARNLSPRFDDDRDTLCKLVTTMCTSMMSMLNGTRGEVATVAIKVLSSTRAWDVDEVGVG